MVGGKPDKRETEEDAVKREVLEELGIQFVPQFYSERLDSSSVPNQPWRVYYFTGRFSGEIKPNPDEISEVTFVTREDLATLDIAFDHRERLTEYFEQAINQN